MALTYADKARIVIFAVPIILLLVFIGIGYGEARRLFVTQSLPTGVGITADKPQYSAGDNVTVYVFNSSSTPVHIQNDCPNEPLAVYKFEQDKWMQIHATAPITKCKGEPRDYEVDPGHVVSVSYAYWPSLFSQSGYYRIAASFESYTNEAATTFTVSP